MKASTELLLFFCVFVLGIFVGRHLLKKYVFSGAKRRRTNKELMIVSLYSFIAPLIGLMISKVLLYHEVIGLNIFNFTFIAYSYVYIAGIGLGLIHSNKILPSTSNKDAF